MAIKPEGFGIVDYALVAALVLVTFVAGMTTEQVFDLIPDSPHK